MDIYVYSDESGVFDKEHNDVYVFGGIILLSKDSKDECTRKYKHAEDVVRTNGNYNKSQEIKANRVTNKQKASLFRSLNAYCKFGAVVNQKQVHERIFCDKKTKQRYLDFVYKIALKRALQKLIKDCKISESEVRNIYIYADEHTTATNGRYELREGLEQEFKFGTFNYQYNTFYEPIFSELSSVNLEFCNSEARILIRAADIIANNIYHKAISSDNVYHQFPKTDNLYISYFPQAAIY